MTDDRSNHSDLRGMLAAVPLVSRVFFPWLTSQTARRVAGWGPPIPTTPSSVALSLLTSRQSPAPPSLPGDHP